MLKFFWDTTKPTPAFRDLIEKTIKSDIPQEDGFYVIPYGPSLIITADKLGNDVAVAIHEGHYLKIEVNNRDTLFPIRA